MTLKGLFSRNRLQNWSAVRVRIRFLGRVRDWNWDKIAYIINIYLLLAECEVCTASYGPSFSFLLWSKHKVCVP